MATALAPRTTESKSTGDYVPVSIALFYPPFASGVDTYLLSAGSQRPILYSSASHPPARAGLDSLAASGVKLLYVPYRQIKAFREQLAETCATNSDIPSSLRFEASKEKAKADFANAWRRSEVDPFVQQAAALAEGVLAACQGEEGLIGHLMQLLDHDGDTFAHLTNVCTYALLLAQGLGVTERDLLLEVGTAALLHDVGKRHVSADILRKPGKLTKAQQRTVADHPRAGFQELQRREDITWAQLMMVYQHHEREDGSGYPVGISGDEIHWMAKVCAVVDIFDALTARRAYRNPTSAAEALEHLDGEADSRLDKETVKCWKAIVNKAILKTA